MSRLRDWTVGDAIHAIRNRYSRGLETASEVYAVKLLARGRSEANEYREGVAAELDADDAAEWHALCEPMEVNYLASIQPKEATRE